jgi:hypothetical protein
MTRLGKNLVWNSAASGSWRIVSPRLLLGLDRMGTEIRPTGHALAPGRMRRSTAVARAAGHRGFDPGWGIRVQFRPV